MSEPGKFTAQVLPGFSPPGDLPDFNPETREIWSRNYISRWMTGEINADPRVVGPNRTPLQQFFNGTVTPFDNSKQIPVTWNAFPKLVKDKFSSEPLRWQIADASRMFQDEYLEWSVLRDRETEDIQHAVFTCEGPEYWQVYASYQKEDFLKTVRELNPEAADDFDDAEFFLTDPKTKHEVYNPNNYWNLMTKTGTILHLIQPNNTLSAEIDIAAQATVIRKDKDGNVITDKDQLINCSKYGNAGRNSDPNIGAAINDYAREGVSLSVANPIALYINKIDLDGLMIDTVKTKKPANLDDLVDIDNPEEIFVLERCGKNPDGTRNPEQGLRLRVKMPEGKKGKNGQQLTVSNIYDTKKKAYIKYGAQIADRVTMAVSAVSFDAPKAKPINCYDPSSPPDNDVSDKVMAFSMADAAEDPVAMISTVPTSLNRSSYSASWVVNSDE